MNQTVQSAPDNSFLDQFNGKFFGVLRWQQLDELWEKVVAESDEGWYLYAVGDALALERTTGEELKTFIRELNDLLHKEHEEDYCGIVYADDLDKPQFIKVFDPNNIGTSCSIATKGPLPGWIISKVPPVNLNEALKPTAKRRRWWQKMFS